MSLVCVDASFALKILLPETDSESVAAKWEAWQKEGRTVISPWLFAFEAMAVLRQKVARKELTLKEGQSACEILWNLGVVLHHHEALWQRAWDLATTYHRPNIYDTAYLALAELSNCELWTADHRFIRSLGGREARVRGTLV